MLKKISKDMLIISILCLDILYILSKTKDTVLVTAGIIVFVAFVVFSVIYCVYSYRNKSH